METRDRLVDALQRAHDGSPWHGPSRADVLHDVTAREAAQRPSAHAHNIWEIVLHMRSWTEEVLRRARGAVPADPVRGDWPPMPDAPDESAWRATLQSLDAAHEELVAYVRAMDEAARAKLVADRPDDAPESGLTRRAMIRSLAEHDVYHTGQLAILKRIVRDAGSPPPE